MRQRIRHGDGIRAAIADVQNDLAALERAKPLRDFLVKNLDPWDPQRFPLVARRRDGWVRADQEGRAEIVRLPFEPETASHQLPLIRVEILVRKRSIRQRQHVGHVLRDIANPLAHPLHRLADLVHERLGGDIGQVGVVHGVVADLVAMINQPRDLLVAILHLVFFGKGEAVVGDDAEVRRVPKIGMRGEKRLEDANGGIRIRDELALVVRDEPELAGRRVVERQHDRALAGRGRDGVGHQLARGNDMKVVLVEPREVRPHVVGEPHELRFPRRIGGDDVVFEDGNLAQLVGLHCFQLGRRERCSGNRSGVRGNRRFAATDTVRRGRRDGRW
jgi:hypothetical protein